MLTTTARKVGNSTAMSIPKQFEVAVGTTYAIYKGSNGSLILTPEIPNPFTSNVPYEDAKDPFWQEQAMGEISYDR